MNPGSKLNYYIPILIFIIMVYRSSWFPGGKSLFGKEIYIIIFFGLFLLFLNLDFYNLMMFQLFKTSLFRNLIFCIFFGVIITTILFNTQELSELKFFSRGLAYLFTIYIYFFLLPKYLLYGNENFNKFIRFIANFGFFAAVFGFYVFDSNPINNEQLVSFITHSNNASIIFTISLPATLYYYFKNKEKIAFFNKAYYLISFIVQLLAQLFTFSRAGMIASFISTALFLIFYYRKKIIWASPLIVLAPVLISGFFSQRGFLSFLTRFYLLIPAFFMVKEDTGRLLWGYGITSAFQEYKKRLLEFNPNEILINDPHNTYVTLLLMFGLIITVLILLFIITVLLGIFYKYLKAQDSQSRVFFIFSICFMVSVLIHGIFDSELVIVEYYTIQFLLTVLGVNYLLLTKKEFRLFNLQ